MEEVQSVELQLEPGWAWLVEPPKGDQTRWRGAVERNMVTISNFVFYNNFGCAVMV